jgi:hypothetical protein
MKHRPWHKVWQDRQLSDPQYLALSPFERGVLADLRSFAARTANHGKTGHTRDSLARWYSRHSKGVLQALQRLSGEHLATFCGNSGEILIPHWQEAQESPKAALMRRLRAQRKKADGNNGVTVTTTVTNRKEAEGEGEAELTTEKDSLRSGRKSRGSSRSGNPTDSCLDFCDWNDGTINFIIGQSPKEWRSDLRQIIGEITKERRPVEPKKVLAAIFHLRRKPKRYPKTSAELVRFLLADIKNGWYTELGCYEEAAQAMRGQKRPANFSPSKKEIPCTREQA